MVESSRNQFNAQETAKRRDEVLRRMLNTPPQSRGKASAPRKKRRARKKVTVSGSAA